MAWEKLIGPRGALPPRNVPKKYSGPNALRAGADPSCLGASVGWQLHGVASVQSALIAIEPLEFTKEWLPEWETPAPPVTK